MLQQNRLTKVVFSSFKKIIDEITGKTIIQRNDSLQLEENETLGIKYLEKIRWINNCSYEVYDIDVLKNENSLNIPTEVFIISLEQLNDSVYNQTVLIKKYNYNSIKSW